MDIFPRAQGCAALAACAMLFAAAGSARAGTWLIGSGSALPGDTFELPISFVGDGRTDAIQVDVYYDVGSIALDRIVGALPGSPPPAGACSPLGSGRIRVMGAARATRETIVVCRLRFRAGGYPRASRLQGAAPGCWVDDAEPVACDVREGTTSVLRATPYPHGPRAYELIAVLAAHPGVPAVNDLWPYDPSESPARLAAFGAAPPVHVFPLMFPRAYGDYAQSLEDAPDTDLARSYRSIVVRYAGWGETACGVAALRADPAVEAVVVPDPAWLEGVACESTQAAPAALPVPALGWAGALVLVLAIVSVPLQLRACSLRAHWGMLRVRPSQFRTTRPSARMRKQNQVPVSLARRVAALALAVFGADAGAQGLVHDVPPSYDGAYFDFAQPGTGLWLDSGPDGTAFGAAFYYLADGRPTFATFASGQSTSDSPGEASAAVRVLRGPLYMSIDGQCLGCPYRAPISTPLADPFVALAGHRDARVTFGATRFDMGAMPLGQRDADLLDGTWWLSLDDIARVSPTPGTATTREDHELSAVVRFVKQPALRRVPVDGAFLGLEVAYAVECVSSCGDFEAWRTSLGHDVRVAAFAREDRNPLAADADFGRYVETPAGLAVPDGSYVHALRVDPYRGYSTSTISGAPRLALYRAPIASPCEAGGRCFPRPGGYGFSPLPTDPSDRLRDRLGGGSVEITGAWYDPRQPGTGLWLDAGRNGETFMTLMTYAARADGGADPVFYTLGGPISPGVGPVATATVRSPLYESRDGQRIGGAWRAPTTQVATELGEAEVRIRGTESLQLRVAGNTYDMVPLRPDRARTALPRGRWLMTMRHQEQAISATAPTLSNPVTGVRIVEVEAAPVARGPSDTVKRPGNAATTYRVRCVSGCGSVEARAPWALWVEPDGIAVLSIVTDDAVPEVVTRFPTQYILELGDETIEGTGFPPTRRYNSISEFGLEFANLSRVRMYRNPPDALCDTDASCID